MKGVEIKKHDAKLAPVLKVGAMLGERMANRMGKAS